MLKFEINRWTMKTIRDYTDHKRRQTPKTTIDFFNKTILNTQ